LAVGALCIAFSLVGGCASFRSDYEEPTIDVVSIRMLPADGMSPRFEIGLRIVNPNRDPLKLQGTAYSLSLEDLDVLSGVAKDLPTIDGYSEKTILLGATVSLVQGIRLVTKLTRGDKDTVSYKLKVKLDVGTLAPAIRIREEGELSLKTLGKKVDNRLQK
jgi:LEA14-like dessication related protein